MTQEEFIKNLVQFEFDMQEYHKHTLGSYGNRNSGLSLIGQLIDHFTRNKYKPMYHQMLNDLDLIEPELPLNEYKALQKRITSAYKF